MAKKRKPVKDVDLSKYLIKYKQGELETYTSPKREENKYGWIQDLIKEFNSDQKEYTPKEYYKGYHWLILHTRPYSSFCEGCIEHHGWKYAMPACIKTATKEHPHGVRMLEDHKLAGGFTDYLFNWLIEKGILLLMVDNITIKCWRDVRRLWDITKAFSFSHKSDDLYYALESYLEPQHRKNLKEFETQKNPTRKELFLAYDWIVSYTNPVEGKLYLGNIKIPDCIADRVNELKENDYGKPQFYLSLASLGLLLSSLVKAGIPLYFTKDGKTITSVADIQRLWNEAGLQNSRDLDWPEVHSVKSHLSDQYLKIKAIQEEMGELGQGEREATEAPASQPGPGAGATTYHWDFDRKENVVRCNNRTSRLSGGLFMIFVELYGNEGTPVTIKKLYKITRQERGYVRDAVVDLKNILTKDLKIDRDLMEKIIEKTPSTGKIQSFTFHKNP